MAFPIIFFQQFPWHRHFPTGDIHESYCACCSESGHSGVQCDGYCHFHPRQRSKLQRNDRDNIEFIFFCFLSAPNFSKTKRGANGKILLNPLLFHLQHPNSKTNEPKFWQNFVRIVPPPARKLPGHNIKEKCPFHFQKKFYPRQIKKARDIFLW